MSNTANFSFTPAPVQPETVYITGFQVTDVLNDAPTLRSTKAVAVLRNVKA
jgi:hypothetical protein